MCCCPLSCVFLVDAALQDPASRAALFMALWTLKESVVKAKGSGISAPPGLKGFSIRERTQTQTLQQLQRQALHGVLHSVT
jgi:phosphopantetheinyl transferase